MCILVKKYKISPIVYILRAYFSVVDCNLNFDIWTGSIFHLDAGHQLGLYFLELGTVNADVFDLRILNLLHFD